MDSKDGQRVFSKKFSHSMSEFSGFMKALFNLKRDHVSGANALRRSSSNASSHESTLTPRSIRVTSTKNGAYGSCSMRSFVQDESVSVPCHKEKVEIFPMNTPHNESLYLGSVDDAVEDSVKTSPKQPNESTSSQYCGILQDVSIPHTPVGPSSCRECCSLTGLSEVFVRPDTPVSIGNFLSSSTLCSGKLEDAQAFISHKTVFESIPVIYLKHDDMDFEEETGFFSSQQRTSAPELKTPHSSSSNTRASSIPLSPFKENMYPSASGLVEGTKTRAGLRLNPIRPPLPPSRPKAMISTPSLVTNKISVMPSLSQTRAARCLSLPTMRTSLDEPCLDCGADAGYICECIITRAKEGSLRSSRSSIDNLILSDRDPDSKNSSLPGVR